MNKRLVIFLYLFILALLMGSCESQNSNDELPTIDDPIDEITEPNEPSEEPNEPTEPTEPNEPINIQDDLYDMSNNPVLLNSEKYNSDNNVYTLSTYLDIDNSTLSVEGEIYFKNNDYNLEEIYLSFYPNAINPSGRIYNVDIEYILINGIAYDFAIMGTDQTQIYINLDFTLNQGERIKIEFAYEFEYWANFGRITEYSNEYISMWFYPFVAIYNEDGWNIDDHTFVGESYFNSIGDYYVAINTPIDYQVASSGDLIDTSVGVERKLSTYTLLNARDFSFSASNQYSKYDKILDGRTYTIYSLTPLSPITENRVFTIVTDTFQVLEDNIGEYAYDQFTVQLGNLFGMESSGIIYCSTDINEETIVHEIIHQWFYSMVGNDQSDYSFLDEAITTYLTSIYYYNLDGISGYYDYLDSRDSLQKRFFNRYQESLGESLLQKVDEYGDQYGYLIYYHGATMFKYYVDEFLNGDVDTFIHILSVYFETYQYKIATLDNLLDIIESESNIEDTKEWFIMQITEFQNLDNRP